MMIHSTIPLDLVLQGMEDTVYSYEDIRYGGVQMQVERMGPDQARIVRLYSGRLEDYLNPALQPGKILSFRAEE
ncbi:hypothetical protein J31TS4_01540 [Paenibacillus sp. J31TS4]|uniref:YlzJ-like family protein n=1 Tax=Paenibacillus sp. J31TS4 TaxID=2807195 RepID=UPI001B23EAB5|nr:YlzJ-like family protein [Paenibacillus sp. J31TS4]GIP36874.1 hypothetical protein J31TS4_01540 [Paenibacillus sp. J31TS4]